MEWETLHAGLLQLWKTQIHLHLFPNYIHVM